jgi:hypothetical protein
MKTWLFMLWSFILVAIISLFSYVSTLAQVFFRSLIMWKGFHLKVPFEHIMHQCVRATYTVLDLPVIAYLFYPVSVVFVFFSNFTIDVEAIDITCEGAQAPLEVFINLAILGITIVVIEGDYQIFRAVTFNSITDQFFEVFTQPCYKAWATTQQGSLPKSTFGGFLSYSYTGVLTVIAKVVGGIDIFQSFLQYLMSCIVWETFIGGHRSTKECDEVDGWTGTDTILATIASVQAVIITVPALYEIAKVLVPGLPENWIGIDDVQKKRNPRRTCFHWFKYFGIPFAFDLWLAALSDNWIEMMQVRSPHETSRNSTTLKDMMNARIAARGGKKDGADKDADNEDDEEEEEIAEVLYEEELELADMADHASGHPRSVFMWARSAPVSPDEGAGAGAGATSTSTSTSTSTVNPTPTVAAVSVVPEEGGGLMTMETVSTKISTHPHSEGEEYDPNKKQTHVSFNELEAGLRESCFRVISAGRHHDTPTGETAGLYLERPGYNIKVWALYPIDVNQYSDVYVLVRLSRATKKVTHATAYDIKHSGTTAEYEKMKRGVKSSVTQFVEAIDACGLDDVVVLYTLGDPIAPHMIDEERTKLLAAVCKCGGSKRVFAAPVDPKRVKKNPPSYVLIGGPACGGEGAGFEMRGDDGNVVDVVFSITYRGFKINGHDLLHESDIGAVGCYCCSIHPDSYLLATVAERTKRENQLWKSRQRESMPSFWTLCRLEVEELSSDSPDNPFAGCTGRMALVLVLLQFGHVMSKVGRKAIAIIAWKFGKFFFICLGFWNKETSRVMHIHEYAKSSSTVFNKPIRKRTPEAYRAYRLGVARGAEGGMQGEVVVDDDGKNNSNTIGIQIDDDGATNEDYVIIQPDPSLSDHRPHHRAVRLRKETAEMKSVQQEELKRKLRADYAMILDAVVCCRSTLLTIVPVLSIISIFACTTARTPIWVYDEHLRRNLPELFIREPFAMARTQERETIEETEVVRRHEMTEYDRDIPNPDFEVDSMGRQGRLIPRAEKIKIDELNEKHREDMKAIINQKPRVVNEWIVFMNGLILFIAESRAINAAVNYFKFVLTVAILVSPPEMVDFWMKLSVIVLLPMCVINALNINVTLGRSMDITDTDLHKAFACVKLSCLLYIMTKITGRGLNLELDAEDEEQKRREEELKREAVGLMTLSERIAEKELEAKKMTEAEARASGGGGEGEELSTEDPNAATTLSASSSTASLSSKRRIKKRNSVWAEGERGGLLADDATAVVGNNSLQQQQQQQPRRKVVKRDSSSEDLI